MIASLGLILLCQLAGEVIGRGLALPLPGPVTGMVLLLALLLLRDRVPALASGPLAKEGDPKDGVEAVSRVLLANMSLLFVPAGVGVIQKLDLLAAHGVEIVAVLAISVMLTLLVTVAVFALVTRLFGRGRKTP
jgi:holin-like protein